MDVHIGSSSYLSKSLRKDNKDILKFSSKKINYRKLKIKFLKKKNIDYFFFFIGKNYKNKKKNKSKEINYTLPLIILKKIINLKKKIRIIFFGSFSELDKNPNENSNYVKHKINLRKKIFLLQKKYNKFFEFVWLYLPNIYGTKQSHEFLISKIIFLSKKNKIIKIKNLLKKIYLLNVDDFKFTINFLKKNWLKVKNKAIVSQYEGPFLLKDVAKSIHDILINKKNSTLVKIQSFSKGIIKPNLMIKTRYKLLNFLKNER